MASQPELPPPVYYPDPKYQTVGIGWTGNYAGVNQYPSYPVQQAVLVQPLPTAMMTRSVSNASSNHHHHSFNIYNKPGLRQAGIGQIVVGFFVIVLDVVACAIDQFYYSYGYFSGLWCGIFFIIAGALAISAVKKNSKRRVKAMVAFSVLSCLLVVVCLAFFSVQISYVYPSSTCDYYYYVFGVFTCYDYSYYYNSFQTAIIALSAFAIVFVIIEGIISIVQSAYGCCELCPECCCPRNSVGPSVEAQMHTQQPQLLAYNRQPQYPVLISTTTTSGAPLYPQQQVNLNING